LTEGLIARELARVRIVLAALPLLESGELVQILPGWYAETRPLSIYYASRKLAPAKVWVFVDYMVEQFGASGYAGRFAGH
jgi:DNA-binding transcriptional LysR family regulator